MALEFFTGFDYHSTDEMTLGRFTTAVNVNVQSLVARNSGKALSLFGGSAVALRTGLSNAGTRVIGFAFRTAAVASSSGRLFVALSDGSPMTAANVQVGLSLHDDGRLQVFSGRQLGLNTGGTQLGSNSANILFSNTWYFIELVTTIHASAGTVEVFVNGSKTGWFDLTGQDTQSTANAYANAFGFNGDDSPMTHYIDDMYILSGTGGSRTARLGDVRAISKVASAGNGTHADSTPLTGSDRGAMVDEATPDNDTTYNALDVNDIDTYNFQPLGVSGTIHGLQILNYVKKSDAGECTLRAKALIDGSLYDGNPYNPGLSYFYDCHLEEDSPDTATNWTEAEVDAAEFGLERTA